jgi:hypothetical protein
MLAVLPALTVLAVFFFVTRCGWPAMFSRFAAAELSKATHHFSEAARTTWASATRSISPWAAIAKTRPITCLWSVFFSIAVATFFSAPPTFPSITIISSRPITSANIVAAIAFIAMIISAIATSTHHFFSHALPTSAIRRTARL